MFGGLEDKCRQMLAALDGLTEPDLSKVIVNVTVSDTRRSMFFDAGAGISDASLQNAATLLVANIASLKDHLKKWCDKEGKPFLGEELINSNFQVAIIHDLWNADKHGGLDRTPRSGVVPKVKDLKKVIRLSAGGEAGSAASIMFDPRTGQMITTGAVAHTIVASIVDQDGERIGDFEEICRQAAEAWELLLLDAGVTY